MPQPSLFIHMKDGSRRWVRPKIRHPAPRDGCACAFKEWVYGGQKYYNLMTWLKYIPHTLLVCFTVTVRLAADCLSEHGLRPMETRMAYEPQHDKTNKMTVRAAQTHVSLGIRPVWSESSLSAWRKLESLVTHWAHSEDSDQTGRTPRLIWVFAERTTTLSVLYEAAQMFSHLWSTSMPNLSNSESDTVVVVFSFWSVTSVVHSIPVTATPHFTLIG